MGNEKITAKEALKLMALGGLVISAVAVPNISIAYLALSKQWKKYKYGDIGRIIKRFQKQELIRIVERGEETLIELSEDGKNRLLQFNFEELNLKRKRDGKIRVVMFDIPNTKKLAREMFRDKLKQLGFLMIQKSVFMTPYECKREIDFIINYLGISKNIVMFKVDKIEIGPNLSFKPMYN